jgi:hypothetical protein
MKEGQGSKGGQGYERGQDSKGSQGVAKEEEDYKEEG